MSQLDFASFAENAAQTSGPTNRRAFCVFNLKEALPAFKGLEVFYLDRCNVQEDIHNSSGADKSSLCTEKSGELPKPLEEICLVVPDIMTCSTCSIIFATREEQVAHFKQDWHRMNLKLRLVGEKPLDLDKFLTSKSQNEMETHGGVLSDLRPEVGSSKRRSRPSGIPSHICERSLSSSSASSVSSTDSEVEIGQHGMQHLRHVKLLFKNTDGTLLSLYRCVLHGKKSPPVDNHQLVKWVIDIPHQSKWAVLMLGGGHFAGAIFDGKDVTTHKTFHRYTVRAKQGTSQSMRDNKHAGSQPKSAGSNLRRYNEIALVQEVNGLMQLWKEMLTQCDVIFYRAAGANRRIFFGGSTPIFQRDDPRLRVISFPTRKASFAEVLRVHGLLSTVECFDSEADIVDSMPKSPHRTCRRKNPSDDGVNRRASRSPNSRRVKLTRRESSLSEGEGSSRSFRQGDPFGVEDSSDDDSLEMLLPPQTIETKFSTLQSPDAEFMPVYELQGNIRDKIYTACKIGDHRKLELLLKDTIATPSNDSKKPNMSDVDVEKPATKSVTFCNVQSEDLARDLSPSPVGVCPRYAKMAKCLSENFGKSKTTLLHVAAQNGYSLVVKVLLENGADPTKKDGSKNVPYVVAANKETKQEFKRFLANNPDLYEYSAAQVPVPLTKEEEAAKAEKRRAQLKAKKERLRKKKEEEEEKQKLELDRLQFLALNDGEKLKVRIARCYQCGIIIEGLIPFEYKAYKFCSTNCVKTHRQKTTPR